MTTVSELVDAVRRELHGMYRPEFDEVGLAIDDDDTSVTLSRSAPGVTTGSYLAIEDEIVMVWGVTGVAAEIRRGMLGTEAVAHDSGTLIEVNPRFPAFTIKDALRKEIRSWSPRIFVATELEPLTLTKGERAVDLDGISADFVDVLKVVRPPRQGQTSWFEVGFRSERLTSDSFPSGAALFLDNAPEIDVDLLVTVESKHNPDPFDNDDELLDDYGIAPTQEDIAVLGAAWRLVAPREARRNFVEEQGEPRSAQEVPAGAIGNSARLLKALRDERVRDEMNRLRSLYPFRRR